MRREYLERYAFLYMCGDKDRKLLLGKEKMTFSDFNRLLYIAGVLELDFYRQEIWNMFSVQFREQFSELEQLYEDTFSFVSYAQEETEEEQKQQWLEEFFNNTPDFVL